jgi:hypothetical protein
MTRIYPLLAIPLREPRLMAREPRVRVRPGTNVWFRRQPNEGAAVKLVPAQPPRKLTERGLRILSAVDDFERN